MEWITQCNFSQHSMKIMFKTMDVVEQPPLLNRCEPGNKIMRYMLVSYHYVKVQNIHTSKNMTETKRNDIRIVHIGMDWNGVKCNSVRICWFLSLSECPAKITLFEDNSL